jgi:hypothetical protein
LILVIAGLGPDKLTVDAIDDVDTVMNENDVFNVKNTKLVAILKLKGKQECGILEVARKAT